MASPLTGTPLCKTLHTAVVWKSSVTQLEPRCECCSYPRLAEGLTVPLDGASHLGGCLRVKQGYRDARCDSNGGVDTGRGWKCIAGAGPKGQQVALGLCTGVPTVQGRFKCATAPTLCERGARAKPALRELFRMAAMVVTTSLTEECSMQARAASFMAQVSVEPV